MTASSNTKDDTGKKHSRWMWGVISLGAVLCGGLIFFVLKEAGESDREPQTKPSAPLVETTPVRRHGKTYAVAGNGFLEPADTVDVVSEVAGKIAYINPELVPGAALDKGALLVRLDQTSFKARLAKAKANVGMAAANLQRAQADYQRKSELAGIGGVPEAQVEVAAAQLATRRAQLAQAKADFQIASDDLTKTTLRAPFDALVDSETASMGDFVSPNAAIATLLDRKTAQVIVGLPYGDAQAVLRSRRTGVSVDVTVSPNGKKTAQLRGRLVEVQRALDRQARTVPLTVHLDEPFAGADADAFFYGTYVDVVFRGASAKSTLYAFDSGAMNGNNTVWRLSPQSTLEKVSVDPVNASNTSLLVIGPLNNGDQLVLTGMPEAADGMKVRRAQPGNGDNDPRSGASLAARSTVKVTR